MINDQWMLLDESGASAVNFTSFIDIDYRNEGGSLAYPVEQGGFANYNKTQKPLDIKLTLAVQGDESLYESILNKLDDYQKTTTKVFISTPSAFYENMTLEAYNYKRARDAGAGMLVVTLNLAEVREVRTQIVNTVITKPKNPTSANNINTGKTQSRSVRGNGFDALTGD